MDKLQFKFTRNIFIIFVGTWGYSRFFFRVGCRARYTVRHPSCDGCTVSQKKEDCGSSQTVYNFSPFALVVPQTVTLLVPAQHSFKGFLNFTDSAFNHKRSLIS